MSVAAEIPPDFHIPARACRLRAVPSPGDPLAWRAEPEQPAPIAVAPIAVVPLRLVSTAAQAPTAVRSAHESGLERTDAMSLRLTTLGRLTLAGAAAAFALALVLGAWLSGSPAAGPARPPALEQVVVHDGDTLWSIAARVAPQRDPRAEVADLIRVNDLGGAQLVPGQILRTR